MWESEIQVRNGKSTPQSDGHQEPSAKGVGLSLSSYIGCLRAILERIEQEQAAVIRQAGKMVAESLKSGGILHVFGTGHSHIVAEEAFFRAGGIAAVNPILDDRITFLRGALESTAAERESGLAASLLKSEDIRPGDVAIIISNSGRNAVSVEMAMEMKSRGVVVVAITNLRQSQAAKPRNAFGKRLFEVADLAIDNCVPPGDALLELPGGKSKIGPSSTVAGAAIINSIVIEAVQELLSSDSVCPVLPSANQGEHTDAPLANLLRPYAKRVRLLHSSSFE